MKKTDQLARLMLAALENKDVLEVACGTADFSVSASRYARSVCCIDLDDARVSKQTLNDKIRFQVMDASRMQYPAQTFDTVVLYNAFSHIQTQWHEIEKECKRVMKPDGVLYVVGTWSLDTNLMIETFGAEAQWVNDFLIVKIVQ